MVPVLPFKNKTQTISVFTPLLYYLGCGECAVPKNGGGREAELVEDTLGHHQPHQAPARHQTAIMTQLATHYPCTYTLSDPDTYSRNFRLRITGRYPIADADP